MDGRRRAESGRGGLSRALLAVALLLAGCRSERAAAPLPAGMDSVPIAGHVLFVPTGFHLGIFRDGMSGPRFMALAPDGSVYVSQIGAGSVIRLVDADHDGVAESSSTVHSGLTHPHGLAFRGDTLYVAEEDGVIRYDPGVASPVQLVSNLPTGGHSTRSIAFGPDNLMYVSIGSSCKTGALWATNNDRDDIGGFGTPMTDSLPPERVNILTLGGNYGWPQCYLPNRPNPEYSSANCSAIVAPAITFTAHSAPLGIAFYTGSMFPAGYQGDAFVAYHGSWDRSVPTGAKVVRVHVSGGVPVSIEDFVVGWQLSDYSRWGRPAGFLVMPDGALLISDDASGRIWRVSYGP